MRRSARTKKKSFLDRLASKAFRGFTIIEVLVVVGIIGVLTAVTATSMNIQRNYENAHDATRKQDVNQIQKALTQYYIDNRCLDLQSDWDYLACNGDVPDKLKPYFSKIPCDPETGEKYYVEFLDKNCKRCDGGCGVCIGLRVLAELKHPKGSNGGSAGGCDEDRGCGVFKPNGHAYNYGVGSNNSCIVPTPTQVPQSYNSPTPTNTLAPIPTATPTPIPFASQIWVANGNNTVTRVDTSGNQLLPPLSGNGIAIPYQVIPVGNEAWVLDDNDAISRFYFDGTPIGIIYPPNRSNLPKDMKVIGNEVWVTYWYTDGTRGITRFAFDGTPLGYIKNAALDSPFALTFVNTHMGGEIWVTNDVSNKIVRLVPSGVPYGSVITGNGLNGPEGIAVVGSPITGEVWVTNLFGNSISRFNINTGALGTITGNGLAKPFGIAQVGSEVWVANTDTNTKTISRFKFDGTSAGPVLSGAALPMPWAVGVIPQGNSHTPNPTSTPTPLPTATPVPTATPTPLVTPTPMAQQIWVVNHESGNGTRIFRLNPNGTQAAPPIAGADLALLRQLLPVGNEVWGLTSFQGSTTSKILRFNKDGTITKPPITDSEVFSGFYMAIVGSEVWLTGNAPPLATSQNYGVFKYAFDGSKIGNFISKSFFVYPTQILQVGNEVWISDHPDWTGVSHIPYNHILRLNTNLDQVATPINYNNSWGKYDDLSNMTIVGSQVWIHGFDTYNDLIIRVNTNGVEVAPRLTPRDYSEIKNVGSQVWLASRVDDAIYRYNLDGTAIAGKINLYGAYALTLVQ